ncbi:MAG: VWA domain-containing protein [Acidobacteria bacterium]|nr:VWA domain-containing protein [Acidobacteriota bacterium]
MRARPALCLRLIALVSFLALAGLISGRTGSTQQTQRQPPASAAPSPSPTPSVQSPSRVLPGIQVDNDSQTVITNSDLITLTVTVTDTFGRFVTGLNQNAFTIFDDKEQQQITFFSDEDAPVSLGVIFDVSRSMGGEKISRAREALAKFIETSHSGDEYFLIGFNDRAQLLLDKTRDSDALLNKLTFVQTKGQTALYDATYLGVEKVTRGTHPKRAVLLISDGQDNSSRYTFTELRRLLKESDVIIYAVGIVSGHDDSTLDMGGRSILEELAGVSGGKAFFPSSTAEMNDTFERIALELRTQYSIGYKPTNFVNDGKWHKLKIKVQPPRGFPRLFVRGREGYYSVTNPK